MLQLSQVLFQSLLAATSLDELVRERNQYLALFGFAVLTIGAVAGLNHFTARRQRKAAIAESNARQQFQAEQAQREQYHFEQGQMINQTGLKKMQLETQLLQVQVQIAEHELAARQRNENINSVAIEKLRLEVESLKLHIREQHKRLDDFSSGYE